MATQVEIKSALWYTTEVKGTFDLVANFKADNSSKRDGYIWILADFGNNGQEKRTRVSINVDDFSIIGSNKIISHQIAEKPKQTDEEIENEISDRFAVLELLTNGVIDRSVKSMIVSGAAGIGKTYTIDRMLLDAEKQGKVTKFSMMTGSCTAIGLYLQLWEHQNPGNVLVLDDIDSIFDDQEALNLLKGALDTGRQRSISWLGASKFLEEKGADNCFDFNGAVIFITNHNFDERIARGTKLSMHYNALISRCMYLDLGIHSMREVIIRIKQVIKNSTILSDLGVSDEERDSMMNWLMENIDDLRKVDLRTVIKLAQAQKAAPNNWERIAKTALCKR